MSEQMPSRELVPVMDWYHEMLKKLPEMRVSITPLADAKESFADPLFFSYANVKVTTPSGSWKQGGIIQNGEPDIPNDAPGLSLLLTDPKGNVFVTVGQEPFAPVKTVNGKELHPVVKTPLQTSAEKMKASRDPIMETIFHIVSTSKGKTVSELLRDIPLSGAPTDANRMQSTILYGELPVSQPVASVIAHRVPDGRWVSSKELDTLIASGTTNGILNIARSVAAAQKR